MPALSQVQITLPLNSSHSGSLHEGSVEHPLAEFKPRQRKPRVRKIFPLETEDNRDSQPNRPALPVVAFRHAANLYAIAMHQNTNHSLKVSQLMNLHTPLPGCLLSRELPLSVTVLAQWLLLPVGLPGWWQPPETRQWHRLTARLMTSSTLEGSPPGPKFAGSQMLTAGYRRD